MVRTTELTFVDGSMGQLEVAMRATILDSGQNPIVSSEKGNRKIPELDFLYFTILDLAIILDGIPSIGIKTRGSGLLPGTPGFRERWRGRQLTVIKGIPHGVLHIIKN